MIQRNSRHLSFLGYRSVPHHQTPLFTLMTRLAAVSTMMQQESFCVPLIMTGTTPSKFCLLGDTFVDQFSSVRQYIRDYHPDYRVTAYSWPTFLYDGHYDAKNPRDGLFKGKLLVKV